MAASVGAFSCEVMRGKIPSLKQTVRFWKPEGHNAYSSKLMGKGDGEFILDVEILDTESNVNTWLVGLEGLTGTVPEIVDQHGDTYTSKIEIIRTSRTTKEAVSTGGSKDYHGEMRLYCLRIAD